MCLDPSQNKSYPTDLPLKDQLNLWLDAADDTTFSYSSGTTVSQWRDKSGQNNHAIVMAGSPLRSVAINSRKAVSFTSTTAFKCVTGSFSSTATHIVVCRATTSSATYQRVYNGGANSDYYVFIGALANNISTFWGSGPTTWFDTNANSPSGNLGHTLLTQTGDQAWAEITLAAHQHPSMLSSTLAHEYGHVLLTLNPRDLSFHGNFARDPYVEEGSCEVIRALWLEHSATVDATYLRKLMNANLTPVYGDGFRMMWKEYEKIGSLQGFLDFVVFTSI
jgi:hypothetical protein